MGKPCRCGAASLMPPSHTLPPELAVHGEERNFSAHQWLHLEEKKPSLIHWRPQRERMVAAWLRRDFGWWRRPSQSIRCRDERARRHSRVLRGTRQTESSEPLTAPQQREDDGRKKGGGAEAPKWDQRRTHQGLVSFFFFPFDRAERFWTEGAWVETQWQWHLHGEPVEDIFVQQRAVVASLMLHHVTCRVPI